MTDVKNELNSEAEIKQRLHELALAKKTAAAKSSRVQIKAMAEVHELSTDELDSLKILHAGMQNRQVLNAFRELRVKLLQKSKGENFICLVSSLCERGGGGSYVATNLAAAFALDKTKTSVLVDCDLYAPSIDTMLNIDASHGITDYLDDDELDVQDIIYASGVPRMRVVPIGSNRERGAEHFSSERMSEFIAAMKARYSDRFIVIDAPPILNSA